MTNSRATISGRSSNNGNGSNRMHPYERNGSNNFGRGGNNMMRGRNPNMRNDFRRGTQIMTFGSEIMNQTQSLFADRQNQDELFMPNTGPPNNRNFGNRNGNNFGNSFSNDRFDQMNQGTNSNFYDDFDFNELSRDVGNLDRQGGNNRNPFNARKNFQGNFNDDNNFGNSNMNFNNQNKQFNPRGGNMNQFSGNSNERFNNDNNSRNFMTQDDPPTSGQHCIHMRGLPYYTDEMDVFNVSTHC